MKPSVTFFAEEGPHHPCAFYRAFLPARALQLHAWQAFVSIDGVVWPDGRFASEALDRPTDIAVIRRPIVDGGLATRDISEEVRAARAAGQTVYVDVDDDLWNIPPTNPAAALMTQESNDAFERVINASDGAIVSTRGLAVSLRTHVDVPVHVCPNGLDVSLYPTWEGEHRPLRLGWLGPVKWRHDDLRSISSWLAPFLNDHPEVEFVHMGGMPDDEFQVEELLPDYKGRILKVPWVPFQCLQQSLEQVDVLVIPQRLGEVYEGFANSRSPTSAMAAVASGCVVWATPIASYREFFGSALPSTPGDLAQLVESRALRRQYRRAQRRLLDQVNLSATAGHYERVFAHDA